MSKESIARFASRTFSRDLSYSDSSMLDAGLTPFLPSSVILAVVSVTVALRSRE